MALRAIKADETQLGPCPSLSFNGAVCNNTRNLDVEPKGMELFSALAAVVLLFLLFLALFEPGLDYRIRKAPAFALNSDQFRHFIEALTASPMFYRTHVEVLTNGETYYEAELEAIRQAQRSINLEAWLDHVISLDPVLDRAVLKEACEFARDAEQQAIAAQNIWAEGTSSFQTGLEIAEILADLKLDQESLVAAVIYRGVREGKVQLQTVQQRFGAVVARLIEGVPLLLPVTVNALASDQGDHITLASR